MKKLFLSIAIIIAANFSMNAQGTNFGVKAGMDAASLKAKAPGGDVSVSETGFYVGAFAEIGVSDKFTFQPELLYISIEDLDQISIPLLAKFNVAEKFSILAGPSIGFMLDSEDSMKSTNFGLEAGISYDISENFLVEARYGLGLSNLLDDAPSDTSIKLNGFFAGLGYRF